ncbi:hypothetical protein [Chryseobacterium shigense]|uniref:Uncharacterized protein n=1 Tax=Chryseobacterium shigense TaxID=297244 RepID=A0A841NAG2_9FLAO|nr:hypothetical protein [Chryseobacterium shigense]MBB6370628.1 hypothetical protein [Chryseobacterium shigense]
MGEIPPQLRTCRFLHNDIQGRITKAAIEKYSVITICLRTIKSFHGLWFERCSALWKSEIKMSDKGKIPFPIKLAQRYRCEGLT